MSDPADEPAAAGDDSSDSDPDLEHAREIGTAMVEQLGEMLGQWLDQISDLVDRGVDPTPLLRGLSGLMRSAADQLDPESGTPESANPESGAPE